VEFEQALLTLDRLRARSVLVSAPDALTAIQVADRVAGPALERVGAGWEEGRVALSQVYMSGRICEELIAEILPPDSPDRRDRPKMAIAVLQDHHLLGKRIVYSALRAAGYEVSDYGRVDVFELVERVRADDLRILLISTLMLNSALRIKEVRRRLDQAGMAVKIIVGGAPFRFDTYLWRDVGADAMGYTATDAITLINQITGGAQ
jgi:methanogenic corrinoid protein MtbC1